MNPPDTDPLGTPDLSAGHDSTDKLLKLLKLISSSGPQRRFPAMSLRQAISSLGLLDDVTLEDLEREDPRLLAEHCADLVSRQLMSREALGHALARMASLPGVDSIDLELMPPAFVSLLWRQVPPPVPAPPPARTLAGLLSAIGQPQAPVESLREAISALQLLGEETLDACERADPSMLRENCSQLVTRVLLTPDELGRALARVAGLPQVDALAFELGADAFERLSLRVARGHDVLPLGLVHDTFFVACGNPTNEDLRRYLCAMTGCKVIMVWAPDADILARLNAQEGVAGSLGSVSEVQWAERVTPSSLDPHGALQAPMKPSQPWPVQPLADPAGEMLPEDLVSLPVIALERLGLQKRDEQTIVRLSSHAQGLVLAAGPAGSGTSTTLHSMRARMNLQEHVIMFGEVRDEETARAATGASLTGHLVLATLHSNSASESVVRLLDLDMEPNSLADALLGVVAQRLVRALCRECAQPELLGPKRFARLADEYEGSTWLGVGVAAARLLEAAGVHQAHEVALWRAVGCPRCKGTGYVDRMGVFEILENNAAVSALIRQRARPAEILNAALAGGMRCLRHDALEKAVQGLLDLEQARTAFL